MKDSRVCKLFFFFISSWRIYTTPRPEQALPAPYARSISSASSYSDLKEVFAYDDVTLFIQSTLTRERVYVGGIAPPVL